MIKNTYFIVVVTVLSLWNKHTQAQTYVCCASQYSDSKCISGDSLHCCSEPNHLYPDCGFVWGLTPSGDWATDPNPCGNTVNVNNNCVVDPDPPKVFQNKQPPKSGENKLTTSPKKPTP